ncbi:MAG: hypothetical protein GNW80_02165 [Asgard group archaeon]|nr:hypothetical protein [Asgard group archaeon]
MAIIETPKKQLVRDKPFKSKRSSIFCTDCVIDWCKIRNKVSYCSQKYKGTGCYSCSDTKCSVKKIAGS